jgi:hypothetical protein
MKINHAIVFIDFELFFICILCFCCWENVVTLVVIYLNIVSLSLQFFMFRR